MKDTAASKEFGRMLNRMAGKKYPLNVIGADDADVQITAEEMLEKKSMQDFIARGGIPQHLVGLVHNVVDYPQEQAQEVSYIDKHGMPMVFFWYKNEPAYESVPNGFQKGDLILSKVEEGYATTSVTKLDLPPDIRQKLIGEILHSYRKRDDE